MRKMRQLAVWFLVIQGVGGAVWWGILLAWPVTRPLFLPPATPPSILLAFVLPDGVLFAGGSLAAAYGLAQGRPWGWPVLSIHAGAAVYAALYCLALPLVSGSGWLAAALMLPTLLALPYFVWVLRPGRAA